MSELCICEHDFKLTPVNESSISFDLELLCKVQPKGKEARFEFKNVAYGISLEYAIKKINDKYVTIRYR